MIAGNQEEIALVLTGRDSGASAAVRSVGASVTRTAAETAAANETIGASVRAATAMTDAEIKKSTASLALYGRTVDVTNAQAVTAFRESAAAEKELLAETNANTDAMNRLQLVTDQFEKRVRAASAKAAPQVAQAEAAVQRIPTQARSAANGLTVLALAASSGGGSLQSMALAGGLASSSLLSMSGNAKLAASANGIGALITALSVAIGYYQTLSSEQGKVSSGFQASLGFFKDLTDGGAVNEAAFQRARARINAERDAAQKIVNEISDKSIFDTTLGDTEKLKTAFRAVIDANAESAALEEKHTAARVQSSKQLEDASRQRDREDRTRLRAGDELLRQRESTLALAREEATGDVPTIAGRRLVEARDAENARAAAALRRVDAEGRALPLTAAELALLERIKQVNSDIANAQGEAAGLEEARAIRNYRRQTGADATDVGTRFRAQEADIEAQAATDRYQLGADAETSIEARKQQRIRALRKATTDAALADAGTLTGALIASGNAELKAIGHFGESIRRVVIGAEAARAGVRSAVEGAEAIASLAVGDLKGAALHGASSLQLAAAAALGFKESLGGGGGNGGGGGSGGGTGADSFTPRNQGGAGGGVTLIVQTVDPTSRAVVNNLRYQFARADTLNVPVPITGGGAVHVLAGAG